MMKTQVFKGANVFMSRNLVPPEVFDALLDALRLNGAEIILCCDPSRNGSSDFHVIASPDHEKFKDLKAKGCNLLGPQCVLFCAKENRQFPKQGFTCCLAMDGLKVLASGFQMDEKDKIESMVTAMGGVMHAKASSDVNFVIVKNVLAAKYRWALNVHRKPVVTINWLYQCWKEHRVVPQEPFRVLPLSGLTICVTRIPADERKATEKLILQNGGKYSAELTKMCTHLIADAAEGDKYRVARKWGHIHIVTRKWIDQSISRKACLDEESFPVHGGSASLAKVKSQEKVSRNSVSISSTAAAESDMAPASCTGLRDSDLDASNSQNISFMSVDRASFRKEKDELLNVEPQDVKNVNDFVAKDSESEGDDLYLSECRMYLLGFETSEMRRLVKMVRNGGGSRYMSPNDKLTHIIVGTPSETQKRQARSFAASGVIQVVTSKWLEDCDRERKEIPVHAKHVAYNLILPQDYSTKRMLSGMIGMNLGTNAVDRQTLPIDPVAESIGASAGGSSFPERSPEEKRPLNMNKETSMGGLMRSTKRKSDPVSIINDAKMGQKKQQFDPNVQIHLEKKSTVFRGKKFSFSDSFPEDRRSEIVEWVNQGGGEVVNNPLKHNVHFTIECHGVITKSLDVSESTYVSSHWIRSCLEDSSLLDVESHILYSPLPCRTPLPGFQNLRLCVSLYEEKDRVLLRNLCFVLGAKFVEKLTKKVTHLLCKYASGPKFGAACKWGIVSVTSEWLYECVKQNQVVSTDHFGPKEISTQDREAGCCLTSQFPSQFIHSTSRGNLSHLLSQSEEKRNAPNASIEDGCTNGSRISTRGEEESCLSKKARLLDDDQGATLPSMTPHPGEPSCAVPDVASAIEDLLEQTSKIQDLSFIERASCDTSLFSSNSMAIDQDVAGTPSVTGLSRHWLNRAPKKDGIPSEDAATGNYCDFSETQTESQVVGYEEDLSGRQMLIDRVRTRSSML